MEKLTLFIVLIPIPDFPCFYYMLGANMGLLLYGDFYVMCVEYNALQSR